VIVIDNGSTDDTQRIAIEFGARLIKSPDKRVAELRNIGVAAAAGEIIAFVDADCEVLPHWLQFATIYFEKSDVIAWGTAPKPPENATWVQKTWNWMRRPDSDIQAVPWLESMNLWVRKKDFLEIGGFNERLVTCEDVDLCYRLAQRGRIVSDTRLVIIHHGEAPDLRTFARKEHWRATSNWQATRIGGFKFRDLPSLYIPIHFGIVLPLSIIISLFIGWSNWKFLLPFFLWLFPLIAAARHITRKGAGLLDVMRFTLLIQIYFASRTAAVIAPYRRRRESR
jgi:glycosyltransferase involved in cell wall biosynthesis